MDSTPTWEAGIFDDEPGAVSWATTESTCSFEERTTICIIGGGNSKKAIRPRGDSYSAFVAKLPDCPEAASLSRHDELRTFLAIAARGE